jgi:hypothetical protein
VNNPAAPNQNSTCAWVDESYARRLWAQLLKARFPNRASLLTVRLGAEVVAQRMDGKRYWLALCFAPGPRNALDLMLAAYNARGARFSEQVVLRITAHAGRRMYQRLRTNSRADIARTAAAALDRVIQDDGLMPWRTEPRGERELALPWGRFHLVADGGMWVAKTFVPTKAAD